MKLVHKVNSIYFYCRICIRAIFWDRPCILNGFQSRKLLASRKERLLQVLALFYSSEGRKYRTESCLEGVRLQTSHQTRGYLFSFFKRRRILISLETCSVQDWWPPIYVDSSYQIFLWSWGTLGFQEFFVGWCRRKRTHICHSCYTSCDYICRHWAQASRTKYPDHNSKFHIWSDIYFELFLNR